MSEAAPTNVRSRILRTAMALFARYGYAGTSVRRIAEESGLTKAGLYYHFQDKAALYRAAMTETVAYLGTRMAEGAVGLEAPAARVRGLLHAHLRLFVVEGHLLRLLYNNLFLTAEDRPPLDDEFWAHGCLLEEALRACADDGLLGPEDVPTVDALLAGAVEMAGAAWLIDRRLPEPTPEIADRFLAVAAPRIAEAAGIAIGTSHGGARK